MKLSLPDFRITPATHFVSLGARCAVAYNLRRFYNFRSAFPFDWWITPASGVVKFLRRPDAEYLYDPPQLELLSEGRAVRHRDWDIQLQHEFPRDGKLPGHPVQPDWMSVVENPKNRTAALIKKFLELNVQGNRIVFVRQEIELADAIGDGLDTLFPLADHTLVVLDRYIGGNDKAFGWEGDPNAWDKALGDLDLSLDRTHHQPFEEKAKVIPEDHFWELAYKKKNSINMLRR